MARLVCKQTLRHTAVSIVQTLVWCLNAGTLRHTHASGARRRLVHHVPDS